MFSLIRIAGSTSLKHLEIRDCIFSNVLVSECEHLESVTSGSECPRVRLDLTVCRNLKYINICSENITEIVIDRGKDCLEATIDARYLLLFLFNGFDAMECTNGRRSFCNIQISTEMLARLAFQY